jgi:hypothetical protein
MIRQIERADGPKLLPADLSRFPGLAQFETVGERTVVQVPRNFETSPVSVSQYNTPNPGKVLLPGSPDAAPAHFKRAEPTVKEKRVKPGATVQLDD